MFSSDFGADEEPNEKPEEGAVDVLFSSDLGAEEEPNENPDEGADDLASVSGLGADEDEFPKENPEEGAAGPLPSVSDLGAEDDPNENPDVDAAGGGASLALLDEPNEKEEAAGPLGDPLDGTAAPNANAVEGEVFGCLAPKENENDLAGVEVDVVSSFSVPFVFVVVDSSFFSAAAG